MWHLSVCWRIKNMIDAPIHLRGVVRGDQKYKSKPLFARETYISRQSSGLLKTDC